MKKEDYIKTQMTIIKIGQAVSALDLEDFLKTINNAEAVAPMLDPTMFMKAQDNLQAIKDLVESLLPVKIAHDKLFQSVLKTASKGHMQMKPIEKDEIEPFSDS